PLREGDLPVRLPQSRLSVRVRLRGARPHVHGLHAEGLRRGDRSRDAERCGTRPRRLRGGAGGAEAAADVSLGDRPVLRAPRRRARLRQPRVQGAAGGIADLPGVLALRRLGLSSSGTRRRISIPTSGPTALSAYASRHDEAATAAKSGGTQATRTPSRVCWKPSAAPVRAAPAASAAAAKPRPFQARLSTPATTKAGTRSA